MGAGFIRGARQDHRLAQKQARELSSLPKSSLLSRPVYLTRPINLPALQSWLSHRLEQLLGGVEDEILAGMIGNVLEDGRKAEAANGKKTGSGWNGRELQGLLGAFLSEAGALEFMEELWTLLLDAQETEDGLPKAWGPAEREKYLPPAAPVAVVDREEQGIRSEPRTRVRSPERLLGHYIDKSRGYGLRQRHDRSDRRELSDRREDRYEERDRERRDYDNRRRDYERSRRPSYYPEHRDAYRSPDRGRSRYKEHQQPLSPERTPTRQERSVSRDTYSSVSRSKTPRRSRSPLVLSRSPVRSRSPSALRSRSPTPVLSRSKSRSPSRSPSRSRSKSRSNKHHKKKKHHHHKKHKRRHSRRHNRSPSHKPDMDELERMLRQKALESLQQ